jgi:hypothetical protein
MVKVRAIVPPRHTPEQLTSSQLPVVPSRQMQPTVSTENALSFAHMLYEKHRKYAVFFV